MAELYNAMGAYDKALPLYQRALSIFEKAQGPEHPDTGTSLNNLAALYKALGAYDKALPLYQRALSIFEKAQGPEHPATGTRLNNLAGLYELLGAYDKALPLYQRALLISEKALGPEHPSTGASLNNLAALYEAMKQPEQAVPRYQRALTIGLMHAGSDPDLLAQTAENICSIKQSNYAEAIFYCKLAVNTRQQQRLASKGMDSELQRALGKRVEVMLNRLLTQAERYVEAEQLLLMLKNVEFSELVRAARGGANLRLTDSEQEIFEQLNRLASKMGEVYQQLDEKKHPNLPLEKKNQLHEKENKLSKKVNDLMAEVAQRLQKSGNEAAKLFTPDQSQLLHMAKHLSNNTEFGEQNVVLVFGVEQEITTVRVIAAIGDTKIQLNIGQRLLNPEIDTLRNSILAKEPTYTASAQLLYQQLIFPIEAHLAQRQLAPKMLTLYLTERLRMLPFAALIDKDGQHLAQRYRINIHIAAAAKQSESSPVMDWRISAFGNSQAMQHYPGLPHVKSELAAIVRDRQNAGGAIPGVRFLDEDFSRGNWLSMLNQQSSTARQALHIATHFDLVAGGWQGSKLILGDGSTFSIQDLANASRADLTDIELVTLSACNSLVSEKDSNGKEFEGLGAVFQEKGAHAVLGTLWAVADDSTAKLMQRFYTARGATRQMSKARALQEAQLSMINSGGAWAHPYYWAGFVLMGNWL